MKGVIFLLVYFKLSLAQSPFRVDYVIVRHVGQGQWVSHVQNDICDHYDFGGEAFFAFKIKKSLIRQCAGKINRLHLSHADLDHYTFAKILSQISKHVCWGAQASDVIPLSIPNCSSHKTSANILFYTSQGRDKNHRSSIYQIKNFLIPGDSPIKMEKIWIRYLSVAQKQNINFLILGHHGSKTSTGLHLLKNLPQLKLAIASARYRKYRHPSTETLQRLQRHHVPMVRTEDWGNLIFY